MPVPMFKANLRRIRLNQGGYDDTGGYWGVGQPLYWYCFDPDDGYGVTEDTIRADDREHAKEIITRKHGTGLGFYR